MNEELKVLVEESMKGDISAFERLIRVKQRDILYITSCYCKPQDVEDYAQEALILMFKNIKQLKRPDRFNDWMYSIVKNTCYYCNRRKNDRNKIAEITLFDPHNVDALAEMQESREEFLPVEFVENEEKRARVIAEVNSLPEHYRDCMLMYFFEEMSYAEIARVLNTTPKIVGNYLQRAKKMLKEKLDKAMKQHTIFSISGVGTVPVLTRIFQAEANSSISPDMCERVTEHAFQTITAIGQTAGAGAAAGSTFALSKTAIGIVSAVVIAGAGIVGSQLIKDNPPGKAAATEMTAVSRQTGQELMQALSEVKADAFAMEDPEDMIGDAYMKKLIEYAKQGVNKEEWMQFIRAIGATEVNRAENSREETFRLYLLEKQDKQLLLISRERKEQDRLTIKYEFGAAQALPEMIHFILMFEH